MTMPFRHPSYPAGPLFLYPRLVFDPAFIGWGRRPGDPCPLAVYDFARCVEAVRQWYEMDNDEAHEYVTTQCEGAWLGPGTPLIMQVGTPGHLEELL
jgi:hypothetical protein